MLSILARLYSFTLQKNIPPLLQNNLQQTEGLQKLEVEEKERTTEMILFHLEVLRCYRLRPFSKIFWRISGRARKLDFNTSLMKLA